MKYKHFAIFSTDTKAGGISTMLCVHSLALVSLGYDVSIIFPKISDARTSIEHIISKKNLEKSFNRFYFDKLQLYAAKIGLSGWLKQSLSNVDGCFVHNARFVSMIKNISSLPVFAINHTGKQSQNKYYLEADMVFSVNNTMKDQLVKFGLESCRSILCPNVILDLPKPALKREKNSIPKIGAMGRMVEKKGFKDFIEALKIIKSRGLKFRAEIAGNGELLNKLKQHSKDLPELKFLGWVDDKEDFYKKLDIFCQPSLFEPFGLTIIEAMSMSCPVISTDCDGPKDIINSGINGLIVPKGNPQMLAKNIMKLMRDRSLRIKIGSLARKKIENNYRLKNLSQILQHHISNNYL